MDRINVVLLELPRMLGEIVSSVLTKEADMNVYTGPPETAPEPPDVVVMGAAEPGPPATAETLLRRFPGLKLVTISADGRLGFHQELSLRTEALAELSPEGLVSAVRRAAHKD